MSQIFNELAAAGRNWAGDAPSGAMLSTMRAFASAATQDDSLLQEAAASLSAQDPGSAAWIAVGLGTLVEGGAAPEISGPAVLQLLRSRLPSLPAPGSGKDLHPAPTPDQQRLLARFQCLCQSAVTHLARLPAVRQSMGQDAVWVERLDKAGGCSHGALWVREALLKSSGMLILLHPPSAAGLRLVYTHVSNCFHLFSLLQTAVGTRIPGGRNPDEVVARVARGKSSDAVNDQAWWHYGNATAPKADMLASLWGEGLVRDIPRVNGEQVILLWPPLLRVRQWDAGFLGPHLEAMPADAAVESVLSPDECKAWLKRLGIERQRKRWWRFLLGIA